MPEFVIRGWHEFRWPLATVRYLPGSSRHFGPARRWSSTPDYLTKYPGTIDQVVSEQLFPRPHFHGEENLPQRFLDRWQIHIPASSIVRLPNVRLVGDEGWIVGHHDTFLLDASYHIRPDAQMDMNEHAMLRRIKPDTERHLPGRTLSLASDFARGGFAHFLHDSLCRLHILECHGVDLNNFDHIYWPALESPTVQQLMQQSGVPLNRIIHRRPGESFLCDDLTATTFPGLPGHLTPPYLSFLRKRFAPRSNRLDRRIYLARSGFSRNVLNQKEIERVLLDYGYEIVLPHIDPETLLKCAEASHIVAVEGSNFFNAFVARTGTKALVIIPDAGQTLPFTMTLAAAAGFDLHVLTARSESAKNLAANSGHIYLDPIKLDEMLQHMEGPS